MTKEEKRIAKNASAKKYREANKAEIAAKDKEYREENKAEIVAKRNLPENKAKKKEYRDTYYEANKEKLAAKRNLPENKAKVALQKAEYQEENKADIAAKQKVHRAKLETKAATNEYQKKRCAENPGIAYYANFLAAIWNFRKFGGKNGAKAFEKAGFTGKDLNERLLPFGKSWDDMEGEHLDHIIPASSFGYPLPGDSNFLACYGLDNLQLLTPAENRAKGSKLEGPKK